MSEQNYRRAFGAAVVTCILLAVALVYVVSHRDHTAAATDENDSVVARGPEATAPPMVMKDGSIRRIRS